MWCFVKLRSGFCAVTQPASWEITNGEEYCVLSLAAALSQGFFMCLFSSSDRAE